MPNVIDLFSGVGGLSLGASRAGFDLIAAVEHDEHALKSHRKNFPSALHSNADIAELTGNDVLSLANIGMGQLDGLIGGPPCQGFSTIGKREEGDHRNNLFDHFFRLVQETQPKFFMAENVPGIMDPQYDDLRKNALNRVAGDYVMLEPFSVSAHEYGAPTTRTRFLFIGYKPEYLRSMTHESFGPPINVQKVTVSEALRGLPVNIAPEWQLEEDGWRIAETPPASPFGNRISGHIPESIGHTESINRYLSTGEVSGCLGTRHCKRVVDRFSSIEIGKQDKVSKSVRLNPNGYCPTLRAGTGKDKGSFQAVRPIHPTESRVITPREAARLQGFPDWFVFHETKWHSFRQIGNSVSPILAEHILNVIFNNLNGE